MLTTAEDRLMRAALHALTGPKHDREHEALTLADLIVAAVDESREARAREAAPKVPAASTNTAWEYP
jgi:hypothetical protein